MSEGKRGHRRCDRGVGTQGPCPTGASSAGPGRPSATVSPTPAKAQHREIGVDLAPSAPRSAGVPTPKPQQTRGKQSELFSTLNVLIPMCRKDATRAGPQQRRVICPRTARTTAAKCRRLSAGSRPCLPGCRRRTSGETSVMTTSASISEPQDGSRGRMVRASGSYSSVFVSKLIPMGS
jgi:hypothetical protein